jgi:hypothetical protein
MLPKMSGYAIANPTLYLSKAKEKTAILSS